MTNVYQPPSPERTRLMRTIFSAVHNPADWRAPIDTTVPDANVDDVVASISFMTATMATVSPNGDGTSRVQSIGYRAGPAGDH